MEKLFELIRNNRFYNHKIFSKGELLIRSGEKLEYLYFLEKGSVVATKVLASGKTVTVTSFKQNNFIGEGIFLGDLIFPVDVMATEESKVILMSRKDFLEFISSEELLSLYFINISRKINHLSDMIEILSYEKIVERISIYLYKKYEKLGKVEFDIPSKTDIAKELSSSREVISRNMSILAKENIIENQRNRVKILDIVALEEKIYK